MPHSIELHGNMQLLVAKPLNGGRHDWLLAHKWPVMNWPKGMQGSGTGGQDSVREHAVMPVIHGVPKVATPFSDTTFKLEDVTKGQ